MTRDDMIADVLATVEEDKSFPGSDVAEEKDGSLMFVRFRWPTGAWLVYAYGVDPGDMVPWPDTDPWPKLAVDVFVSGGGRLVPAQLEKYRSRPCQLHLPETIKACGCPTMYEVLAAEMLRKSKAKLEEIAAAAERPSPAPGAEPGATSSPSESAAQDSSPSGSACAASSPPSSGYGPLWTFRCLDCKRSEVLPSVPPGWGDTCPECGHAGVLIRRADWPDPPGAHYANVIVADGVLEEPAGGACYVCGGPLARPGGKCAVLRGGFVRAHLACVQEKREKTARGVTPFVRVGDPKGYCHACKAPFRGGDLTILCGKAHALFSLCQAGPTPPSKAPPGRTLGRAMKRPCVVCELPMEKGQVVTQHLDGDAHMLCVTVPEKLPQDAIP